MSVRQIMLNEKNSGRAEELARLTGKAPDQLVNEAFERFAHESEQDEQRDFGHWRNAMLRIEGMWADRDDLPHFAEIRGSWDRDVLSR